MQPRTNNHFSLIMKCPESNQQLFSTEKIPVKTTVFILFTWDMSVSYVSVGLQPINHFFDMHFSINFRQ